MFKLGQVIDKNKVNNISPVVLAFVGDAVYSLFVREKLASATDYKCGELNKMATSFVKASAQAQFVNDILPLFNEEELAIFKRARNAKKVNKAKSASISDYNLSTGFEAVLGYLHLTGQTDRLNYLLYKGNKDEDWGKK